MDIAFHIGALCTDEGRLLMSLLRNAEALSAEGVAIPGPGRYRKVLREAIRAQLAGTGAADSRAVLLDAMLDGSEARRLILSVSSFLALPQWTFDGGAFMATSGERVTALQALFPEDRIELQLAIRNPATHLPALWAQAQAQAQPRPFTTWLQGADPFAVRWSSVVAAMRAAEPSVPLTIWCNEDSALVWGEVLAALAGVAPDAALLGRHDLALALMLPEGAQRFESYMAQHPGQTAAQERRVVGAFLERYADPAQVEEELDLPDWDQEMVDDLTRAYEEDVQRIARMPGVTLVQP
jgi:hypothetical protein